MFTGLKNTMQVTTLVNWWGWLWWSCVIPVYCLPNRIQKNSWKDGP